MSHAIYQTPALILSTTAMRESNKLIVLYTRDFGLVYVAAQSIREQSSKMKAHIQTYSLVDVDLVQGKDIWRLTGVHERYSSLKYVQTQWYPFMEKISLMVKRLCPGEEVNSGIWDDIYQLFELIFQEHTDIDESVLELVFLSRLLNHLGYWSGNEVTVSTEHMYSPDIFEYVSKHKSQIIKNINRGLERSQL